MPKAPLPPNEDSRLKAISANPYLRQQQDPWANKLVLAAKQITNCPIALVTILEDDRQWFLGCVGLDEDGTQREQAFCGYTILTHEPLVVEDATKDQRFADNTLVTNEPGIRFYAGIPIYDDQQNALGSLCVIDTKPRSISDQELETLKALADLVSMQIGSTRRHEAIMGAALDAIVTIDSKGTIIEFNEPACRMFGYSAEEALHSPLAELIIPPSLRDAHHAGMQNYFKTGEGPVLGKRIEVPAYHKSGSEFPVELAISPVSIAGEECFTAFIRDLSETHELNAKLRLMGFSIDSARDMVFWVGPDASFVYVNDAACDRLGYAREQLLNMRVFDIDSTLPKHAWQQHWDELRTKGAFTLESTHQTKNGETFPVEVGCNYIEHEGNEYNCVIARDVTERVKSDQALTISEERFRDIADAAGEYIWETDEQGDYTYVSDAIEAQLGIPADQIIGSSIFDKREQEDASLLRETLDTAAATQEPFQNLEFRCTHADNSLRWQRLSGKALFNAERKPIGFRGMGLDVTSFKLAGEQARRIADLQATAQRVAAQFLLRDNYEVAARNLLSTTAKLFNARSAAMHTLTPTTTSIDHLWHAQSKHAITPDPTYLKDAISTDCTFTHTATQQFGQLIAITIPLDSNEQLQLLYTHCNLKHTLSPQETELIKGMARGMGHAADRVRRKTELLNTTQQLEAALELAEQASLSKTTFLAHMSHELRTPLTSVLGFTEILQQGAQTEEQQRLLLARIHNSGRSLLNIINSILDLSKIETDTLEIRAEHASVSEVIQSAANSVLPSIADAQLDFKVIVGQHVPESCLIDPVRLYQILTNLLKNAATYTDEGSINLSIDALDNMLTFTVTDTGRGIPPNLQAKIFEAFDRGAEGPETTGTGLGLAIVRRLLSLMNGNITLSSSPGEGSQFTVSIPLLEPTETHIMQGIFDFSSDAATTRHATNDTHTSLDGISILLVEDSQLVRDVVEYFLKDRGAAVTSRVNGQQAVDAILKNELNPDLVLMDMQMPILDGYNATRTLRRNKYTKPIIALTAHGLQHDRDRCLAAGCDDYVSKPVDPDQLASTCARHARTQSNKQAKQTKAACDDPMAELKRRYMTHLKEELQDLAQANALDDLESLRRRAHKLAGSAGNFGYPEITEAARACEDAIRASEPIETITKRLSELTDSIATGLASTSN